MAVRNYVGRLSAQICTRSLTYGFDSRQETFGPVLCHLVDVSLVLVDNGVCSRRYTAMFTRYDVHQPGGLQRFGKNTGGTASDWFCIAASRALEFAYHAQHEAWNRAELLRSYSF